jgi:allantoicase
VRGYNLQFPHGVLHVLLVVAPGRGECMGDGWETARQPLRPACYKRQADGLMLLPGQDWALIKCGKSVSTEDLKESIFHSLLVPP